MTNSTDIPTLSSLAAIPYLDDRGQLPDAFQGKVGVYAIFDQDSVLQYIGYSRDTSVSLKQHLVRRPQQCHWVKVQTIDRPSRTILEEIRSAWISENGSVPVGNAADEALWSQAIDIKTQMTPEEQANLAAARRVEAEVMATLKARGVETEIRFNPKLKETGLLDLK